MNIQDPEFNPGTFPIFINPTFDEILKLAETRWDTVRILASEKDLVLASGYGNTHSSMIQRLRAHHGRKMLDYDSFILFHEYNTAYFNLEDVTGDRVAGYSKWRRQFCQDHVDTIKDLIRESGLTLG